MLKELEDDSDLDDSDDEDEDVDFEDFKFGSDEDEKEEPMLDLENDTREAVFTEELEENDTNLKRNANVLAPAVGKEVKIQTKNKKRANKENTFTTTGKGVKENTKKTTKSPKRTVNWENERASKRISKKNQHDDCLYY